jgi:putative ABC transport system permease protein
VNTIGQVLATLRRRPLRTFLTALGTALGIATIVALLAVAAGAQQSAGKFLDLGPSDLGLFQADAADPTTSVLPTAMIPRLLAAPGISGATPLILMISDISAEPGAVVFGADAHSFLSNRLVFLSGHTYTAPNQIAVGNELASELHVHVGSTTKLAGHTLHVVGIYHIGVAYQDEGAFIPLATAQSITGRQGETTTIAIKLGVATSSTKAQAMIHKRFPGLLIIGDGDEAPRAGANAQLLAQSALVIAVLALVIGGIGVMNTMLMAVIERRSEFALLSAVGWSGRQIAGRVVIEGVITTLLGTALGLLLGVIGAQLLVHVLGAAEFVSPDVQPWILGRALLVGVLLGVLGGLYPAWRAARVSPAHVLAQR